MGCYPLDIVSLALGLVGFGYKNQGEKMTSKIPAILAIDIEKVAQAIEADAGEALPDIRQSLAEAQTLIAAATQRGEDAAKIEPRALSAKLDDSRSRLVLNLEGGAELSIPVACLGFPENADLSGVRVEGGGFDLYFPAIDDGAFVPNVVQKVLRG